MYLFICYLSNIILFIEYAQGKEDQIIAKGFIHPLINIPIYLFFFLPNFLGFTNPTPLTEISSSRFVRTGM
jgi:hypothetical protein